jgi:hypothetical protein
MSGAHILASRASGSTNLYFQPLNKFMLSLSTIRVVLSFHLEPFDKITESLKKALIQHNLTIRITDKKRNPKIVNPK